MAQAIIVFDIETTQRAPVPMFSADPFYEENHAVYVGYHTSVGICCIDACVYPGNTDGRLIDATGVNVRGQDVVYKYASAYKKKDSIFSNLLERIESAIGGGYDVFLVGHNIKFDLHYMCVAEPYRMQRILNHPKVKLWDTMAIEHVLCGQDPDCKYSLEATAERYGIPFKKSEVVQRVFDANKGAESVPVDEMLSYLASDVEVTRTIFQAQLSRIREQDQVNIVKTVSGATKAIQKMEYNGIAVDYVEMLRMLKRNSVAMDSIKHRCHDHLCSIFMNSHFKATLLNAMAGSELLHIPEKEVQLLVRTELMGLKADEGLHNSNSFLSALLFGGVYCIKTHSPDIIQMYSKKGKAARATKLRMEIEFGGIFDPAALSDSFESVLGAQELEKKRSGVYSTSRQTLENIQTVARQEGCLDIISMATGDRTTAIAFGMSALGLIEKVLLFRDLYKESGTYLLPLTQRARKHSESDKLLAFGSARTKRGGPKITASIVHHTLNQAVTRTGRLSSSNPNMQNITNKDDSNLRTIFTSRYGNAGRLVAADYKQLEVVAAAYLSNDANLRSDIINGVDIHTEIGKKAHGLGTITKEQRRDIKSIVFGTIYGGGPATLASQSGQTRDFVKDVQSAFFDRYPGLETLYHRWLDAATAAIPDSNDLRRTKAGNLAKAVKIKSISGRYYTFIQEDPPPWVRIKGAVSFNPSKLRDYPVQGFATGDIMQAVMAEVINDRMVEACEQGIVSYAVLPINQTHDELLFDVPSQEEAEDFAAWLKRQMEDANVILQEYFDIDFDLPLTVEISCGPNLKDMAQL